MSERQRAERRGRLAEICAALYLIGKGYRPLAWRVRTRSGEIDLVMRSRSHIVFVEVKTRRDPELGLISVSGFKARRTVEAARIWLARNSKLLDRNCRFDILIMAAYHWPRHIKSAFDGDGW